MVAKKQTNLKMGKGNLRIWLGFAQPLQNYSVRPFGIKFYLSIWAPDDCRHPFPGGIELANFQYLEFLCLSLNIHEHGFRFSCLEEKG